MMKSENKSYSDLCICCGEPVPEGRMVCFFCEIKMNPVAPGAQAKSEMLLKELLGMSKERRDEP